MSRAYTSVSSVFRAVEKAGLKGARYDLRIEHTTEGWRFTPVFVTELPEDREYIRSKGFEAVLAGEAS